MPRRPYAKPAPLWILLQLIVLLMILNPIAVMVFAQETSRRRDVTPKYTGSLLEEGITTTTFQPVLTYGITSLGDASATQSPLIMTKVNSYRVGISFSQAQFISALLPYSLETNKEKLAKGLCAGFSRLFYLLSNEEFSDFLGGLHK